MGAGSSQGGLAASCAGLGIVYYLNLLTVRVETGHHGLDFALVLLQLGRKLVTSALSAVWFGFTNKTVWLGLIIIVVAQGKSAIAALCWQQTNTHGHTTLWLPIYLMVFWACTIESLLRDVVGNGFELAGGSV